MGNFVSYCIVLHFVWKTLISVFIVDEIQRSSNTHFLPQQFFDYCIKSPTFSKFWGFPDEWSVVILKIAPFTEGYKAKITEQEICHFGVDKPLTFCSLFAINVSSALLIFSSSTTATEIQQQDSHYKTSLSNTLLLLEFRNKMHSDSTNRYQGSCNPNPNIMCRVASFQAT